jgi:uncharacterized protein YegJ (DUF2314 family)
MSRTIALTLLLLFLFPLQSNSKSLSEKVDHDDVVFMADEDPAMQRAFMLARSTLDVFFSALGNPPEGTGSYAAKVGISEGDDTEYFWLIDLDVDGEHLTGTISNKPGIVGTVRQGQRYSFTKKQIVDWTYLDRVNRKTLGNFTACALFSQEPEEGARALMKQYGFTCK